MSELPLVSVAVVNYNNSKYVIDTLNSVSKQTYSNIELIIADDWSVDNSVALIKKWLKDYKGKYKFFTHKSHRGAAARNTCLRNASGEYFSLMAAGDILLPEKTAKQLDILKQSGDNVAAVYSDVYLINESGSHLKERYLEKHGKFSQIPSGNIYEQLFNGNFIPGLSMLIKRSVLDEVGPYDESLLYEDYDMWLRVAEKYDVVYSDAISGKFRVRRKGANANEKNIAYSTAKIFLGHTDSHYFPMQHIRDIAWNAYLENDKQTLPVIRDIAAKTHDRLLMAAYMLWKFGVPVGAGKLIFDDIKKHIAKGLSAQVVNGEDTDVNVFLNEIIHSLTYEQLQAIICEGYKNENEDTLLLLDELAAKTDAPYFITARMLWKMGIPYSFGEPLLKELSEKIGVKIKSRIKEDIEDGGEGKPDDIFEMGSDLFVNEIIPYLGEDLLLSFAYNAYANSNKKAINFVKGIVERTNDRMLLLSSMLWELDFSPDLKKELLLKMKDAVKSGLPTTMAHKYGSAVKMFLNEVMPHIQIEDYKKIAVDAYYTNNKNLKPVVKEMLRKTGNRYFKAVLILWKYKINAYTGEIILDRIDGYCKKNLSKYYIDLCIYKDTFGAMKTKNTDLFGRR
jgi:glycosyltransferase involved in cell wall biosynthesis